MRPKDIFPRLHKRLALAAAIACLWLAAGCSDVLDAPDGNVPEGLPAVISLNFDLGEMTPISRADLHPDQDKKVTSLWVAVYNVKTGARTGLYTSDEDNSFSNFHQYKKITLSALSGESYVVAVANYKMRYATFAANETPVKMTTALEQADTWEKYCKLAVFFDKEGKSYFEAPAEALVMSGYYTENNGHGSTTKPEMATLTVTEGMSNPKGAIHLRRMISQVKFKINYNSKNIKSFEVTQWSVENLPTNSWLHERPADYKDNPTFGEALNSFDTRKVKDGFNNSDKQIVVGTSQVDGQTVYSFDFYQLENRRKGINKATDHYSTRELEHKNDDGTNSGKYVALVNSRDSDDPNNNATYVKFHVVMEMKLDQDGNDLSDMGIKHRVVETDYVVHLGYINKDATDFNCYRNAKYTYNVTINNVSDVLVEAKKEGEKNPAVEGFVSDISESFIELDAHYGVFNIYLEEQDIKDFKFYMEVPTMEGTTLFIDENNVPAPNSTNYQYFKWVELRKTEEGKVAAYDPARTILLDKVKNPNAKRKDASWYTVFINEYVYENAEDGNESKSTNWHKYVNKPNRRVWLNVSTHISADHNTIYNNSKYAFSQQSIQCYYDVDNTSYTSAIGVEHVNESFGLTLRNNFNYQGAGPGNNVVAGRYNLQQFLENQKNWEWKNYLDYDKNSFETIPKINNQGVSRDAITYPLRKIKRASISEKDNELSQYEPSDEIIQAITACMNRNRDLNGDGIIQNHELRWFVPTSNQAVRLILGRQALQDPMLDPKGLTKLENSNNGYNTRFMFYTSDGKNLWAMEGTSLSTYREWPTSMSTPWEVRCVRNLGSDMSEIADKRANEPAFTVDLDNNIVDLTGFDSKCLREQPYVDGVIPVHHINDQTYNRPYKKFEFKDTVIGLTDPRIKEQQKSGESWSDYITRTNPCSFYNTDTKKGWRLPNQKEAAILGLYQKDDKGFVANGNTFYGTCSFSFFDRDGYAFGSNPNNNKVNSANNQDIKIRTADGGGTITDLGGYPIGIRCVRDMSDQSRNPQNK